MSTPVVLVLRARPKSEIESYQWLGSYAARELPEQSTRAKARWLAGFADIGKSRLRVRAHQNP